MSASPTKAARASAAIAAALVAAAVAAPRLSAEGPETGESLYAANCASCHGAQRGGGQFGPALRGAAFDSKWHAAGLASLQAFLHDTMPPGAAGTLSQSQYAKLAALLLGAPLATDGKVRAATASPPDKGSPANPAADLDGMLAANHVGPIPPGPEVFADAIGKRAVAERRRLVDGLTPVTDAMLARPPAADWLSWRGSQGATSYSPLDGIDRASVPKLRLAWSWSMPASSNEAAPLIHDGVLFVQSGEAVEALDARDGTLLWRYRNTPDARFRGTLNETHRNFALYGRTVLVATADRNVIALDMRDGRVVWKAPVVGLDQPGQILSAGPVAAQGKVIQPTTLGTQCLGGCAFVALDAATGKQLWRTLTIPPAGGPLGDSWNGATAAQRRGAGSWVAGSVDPATGLLYAGTGGTYLVTPLLSPGPKGATSDALYTNSTLAIDLNSGRIAWHHQHMPREVWDLDEAFERLLVTLPIDGVDRDVVVTIGKIGIADVLDRRSGKFLFAYDLGTQNLVSAIDPSTGRRTLDPAKTPRPDTPTRVCPSAEGARNWQTTAFNPSTRLLFVPMGTTCMDWIWTPNGPGTGDGMDIAWSLRPDPRAAGNFGRIDAVDLAGRKTLWSVKQRAPIASSLLATGGGLVFFGDRARYFKALDDRSGAELWSVRLGGVPSSSPATYSVDGKQYVVVVTGGGGPHDVQSVSYTPEIVDASAGVTIWVFALAPDGAAR